MADFIWTDYVLPSKGRWYGDKLPGGKVKLRRMTTREAALLDSDLMTPAERTNKIIDSCMALPEGCTMKPSELLSSDRFAVLLTQRVLTFGPHYEFKIPTGGRVTKHSVNLLKDLTEVSPELALIRCEEAKNEASTSDVGAGLFTWGGEEPFEVKLPDSGKTVTLRFMRGADEDEILKAAGRAQGTAGSLDDVKFARLAKQILKIDGERPDDIIFKRDIRDLSFRDSLAIERAVEARETGIDTKVTLNMPGQGETQVNLPMTSEFFRPARV